MNRRRSNRIEVFLPVFVFQHGIFLEEAYIANTSLEGMYFYCNNKDIKLFSQIQLQILHTHENDLHCTSINGSVRFSDELGYGLDCRELPLKLIAFIYDQGMKNLYRKQGYQYQLSLAV